MKRKRPETTSFPGFAESYDHNPGSGPFLMYPLILEEYWYALTGAEQKVLDFIIRQTIGWKKTYDTISWSQFALGVGGKGRGKGTGLSVSQIRRAVKGLEKKGFIEITFRKSRPCIFYLVIEDGKRDSAWKQRQKLSALSEIESEEEWWDDEVEDDE